MWREVPRYILVLAVVALVIANIFAYRTILTPRELEVAIFDTGESRAALIRTQDNIAILVNAGRDASILRLFGERLSPWKRNIDIVILTSAESRSGGGLPDVLNRYRVSHLIRFGAEGSKSFETALAAAASAEIGMQQTRAPYGARLRIGNLSIKIISPSTFSISSGSTSLRVSSTTSEGVYIVSETGARKIK